MSDFTKIPIGIPVTVRLSRKNFQSHNGAVKLKGEVAVIVSNGNYGAGNSLGKLFTIEDGLKEGVVFPQDCDVEIIKDDSVLKAFHQAILKNPSQHLYHGFMIGSDPEMFIVDKNKQVIPAFNFLPAKESPLILDNSYRTPVYWDGFQAEFSPAAYGCMQSHNGAIREGLMTLIKAAKEKYPGAKLSHLTTVDIPANLLQESAEEHVQFGCMPSKNIYGIEGIKMNGREVPFRSAGGHLHFGIGRDNQNEELVSRIVKALDAIIGVASVSLFAKLDDPKRRLMYGLAGEYRLPEHGLEYRVLSNAWLCHPMIAFITVDLARKAVMFGKFGMLYMWDHDEKETIRIINECDVDAARTVLKKNKEMFKNLCRAAYYSATDAECEALFNMYLNGVESVIKDVTAVESNWSDTGSREWRHQKQNVIKGSKVG